MRLAGLIRVCFATCDIHIAFLNENTNWKEKRARSEYAATPFFHDDAGKK